MLLEKQLGEVSFKEKILILQASLIIPLIEIALRTFGLRRINNWLIYRPTKISQRPIDQFAIERICQLLIHANTVSIYNSDCLTQSLALQYLLKRKGIPTTLMLGARTLTGQIKAHAWLEHNGAPLGQKFDVKAIYTSFDWSTSR